MAQPPLVRDPLPPLPTPDGLFRVLREYGGLSTEWDPHYANAGALWVPDTCVGAEVYAAACLTPPYSSFTLDGIDGIAQAWPIAVYSSLITAGLGISNDEARRRVVQRLYNYEQNVVEKATWGGTATLFTNQQNYAGTVAPAAGQAGVAGGVFQQLVGTSGYQGELSGGTGVGVVEAVSLLEQSAADHYYGQALIHARPRMAAYLAYRNQFKFVPVPPIEQTWNEDALVLGNGYTGVGPANEAVDATSEYMWTTGRMMVWQNPDIWVSPPEQLLNRTNNQRGLYAFRQYIIGVECFSASVKVVRANV